MLSFFSLSVPYAWLPFKSLFHKTQSNLRCQHQYLFCCNFHWNYYEYWYWPMRCNLGHWYWQWRHTLWQFYINTSTYSQKFRLQSFTFTLWLCQFINGKALMEDYLILSRLAANWRKNKRQSNWPMNGRGCKSHPKGKRKNKMDRVVVQRARKKKAKRQKKKRQAAKEKNSRQELEPWTYLN